MKKFVMAGCLVAFCFSCQQPNKSMSREQDDQNFQDRRKEMQQQSQKQKRNGCCEAEKPAVVEKQETALQTELPKSETVSLTDVKVEKAAE